MAAPTLWYLKGIKKAVDSVLALGIPKVMFLHDTYVLDQDNHDFIDDVSANEATGTGVSAGGVALTSVTTTVDGTTNTMKLDAADVTGINLSACYAVVYVWTGTASTSPVLAMTDLSDGTGVDGEVLGIVWGDGGIVTGTAA